jgi:branched-chain amino acid transport system permease protein
MNRTRVALAVAAAACVAVPWVIGNDYYVNLASQIIIYALLALSVNLLLGFGGMVSLGHAAFLGLTGYCAVLLLMAGYSQLTTAILAVVFSTVCAARCSACWRCGRPASGS